jgi:hypothetical protein
MAMLTTVGERKKENGFLLFPDNFPKGIWGKSPPKYKNQVFG